MEMRFFLPRFTPGTALVWGWDIVVLGAVPVFCYLVTTGQQLVLPIQTVQGDYQAVI